MWAEARRLAEASGTELRQLEDPWAAVDGADVLYTDTWYSMGQEAERELRQDVFPPVGWMLECEPPGAGGSTHPRRRLV